MAQVPLYERRFFDPARRLTRIGGGALGGKAEGLIRAAEVLEARGRELAALGLDVDVPSMTILGSDAFDAFLERNDLLGLLDEDMSDERVVQAFRRADLPAEVVGDLHALAAEVKVPLAVRSSSVLEDRIGQPFAGVYGTKMIACAEDDVAARFRSLRDAVKYVYATAFFHQARAYLRAAGRRLHDEKMAVIVQEVVGRAHGPRFYPDVSGVARSYSFYPFGPARPEEGVVDLALGLGKTIVDGGVCWTFSPAHPRAPPPFGSVRELVKGTQIDLWAVAVGPRPPYDPMAETEYLIRANLGHAEADGTLRCTASTYDPEYDRLVPGTGRPGPRVLDFAPILKHDAVPLVATVRALLAACEAKLGAPVEVEFAASLPAGARGRFGFLQVRPLLVSAQAVSVPAEELESPDVLVGSTAALGNGERMVEDVVFVEPTTFERRHTPSIAAEIAALDRSLVDGGRPYLLIGFGRWGSSDPWLGIPVRWDQIAGAKGIVEATLGDMNPEPSQGSHFFHNLASFEVVYFSAAHAEGRGIDWAWLGRQEVVARTEHVRHVRTRGPLVLRVDGRSRRGVIRRPPEP
jgi:hypothetical protein